MQDCMKKFCEFLRKHAMKIINFKNKKMKLLTKEHQESYENAKICYICNENIKNKCLENKKYRYVWYHCHHTGEYRGAGHSICNLKCSVPKKIIIFFHNRSNSDYHFIIKELAEESKKQLTCLGENTEKCITFTVPIEKEVTTIDKNGEEITKSISYISNLLIAQDLWQVHYQILPIIFLKKFIELNVNTDMMIKILRLVELNISVATTFLNTETLKRRLP